MSIGLSIGISGMYVKASVMTACNLRMWQAVARDLWDKESR